MKKIRVLILCYDYHPLNTVGAHRINAWAKYLPNHQIYPIIFTRKWSTDISNFTGYNVEEKGPVEFHEYDNFAEVRVPNVQSRLEKLNEWCTKKNHILLRKALTLLSLLLRFVPGLNVEKNIYAPYYEMVYKKFKPDLIIASGEPFVLFKYAHDFSRKYKVPYVVDYRDGWSTNVFRQNGLQGLFVNYESRFERKFLKQSFFATIASSLLKEELLAKFGKHDIEVIENGVDLELVNSITSEPDPFFSIVYTGTVYAKHNVPAFLKAFEQLIPLANVQVNFVGTNYYAQNSNTDMINEYAQKYPDQIKITDRIPKKEAIRLQKKASVLLKFSSGAVVKGFYGAKLYEYASINKPILNVVAKEEHAKTDFFNKEKIQTFVWDTNSCFQCLKKWQLEFEQGKLKNDFLSKEQLENISRRKQTEMLAELILNKTN